MQFSIEVTPGADIAELPTSIREVSITLLPGVDCAEVVAQAVRLREQGFDPIPHISARSLRSRIELTDFVAQLRAQADIRQVLLISGSQIEPLGPYTSALDLLETGLFGGLRIGVAGHPEGMPQLSEPDCDRILALKNEYARSTGTDMFVITQWALDRGAIATWLDRIDAFNSLPIYLGIPGPTTPAGLLKFAKICGVKTSLLGLRHQSGRFGQLLTLQTPDPLVEALSHRIEHFHIFTFGGIKRTRDWLLASQSKALTRT